MKLLLSSLMLVGALAATGQTRSLEKLWETDSIVATPESVLPDTKGGVLYVSLINGGPWEADGKGGVARLKLDGSGYDSTWITGLHAPKGMGLYGGKLYVADLGDVVVIDVSKGTVEKRIPIDSATGLNDVTVTGNGVVYVSDSKTARVWRLEKDVPSLFMENLKGVNGLKAVDNDLLIASGKTFIKTGGDRKSVTITELPMGGDGVEPVGNGDYLVSTWSGAIYYVSADGKVETLLDTQAQKRNTADIGYDPATKTVYVPTFFARTVAAYRLK